jgi:pilus assembly protein CpaD
MLNAPRSGGEGALRAAADARLRLMDMGVPYDAIAIAAYEGGAETAPLVLSFTRYEATAPRCAPIWEQDLMRQYDNQPYESFGCANAANLAAMIEDPHDLVAARDETARDSARRAAVVDRYRRGQPTGATRSGDERVTISNAVN